jgi:predicted GIY-YIG superfamily endonuclease
MLQQHKCFCGWREEKVAKSVHCGEPNLSIGMGSIMLPVFASLPPSSNYVLRVRIGKSTGQVLHRPNREPHRACKDHNRTDCFEGHFTRKNGPWKLVWSETHNSRSSAVQREQQIKRMKSSKWIRTHLLNDYPAAVNPDASGLLRPFLFAQLFRVASTSNGWRNVAVLGDLISKTAFAPVATFVPYAQRNRC